MITISEQDGRGGKRLVIGTGLEERAHARKIQSRVCDGYDVEQLDPAASFLYHVENPPFSLYHFVAHLVIMRNALTWERYRRHSQWLFTTRPPMNCSKPQKDMFQAKIMLQQAESMT